MYDRENKGHPACGVSTLLGQLEVHRVKATGSTIATRSHDDDDQYHHRRHYHHQPTIQSISPLSSYQN